MEARYHVLSSNEDIFLGVFSDEIVSPLHGTMRLLLSNLSVSNFILY